MGNPRGRPKKTQVPQKSAVETIKESKSNLFFIPRNYARSNLTPLFASSTTSLVSAHTVDEIFKLLKNPYQSYKQLQNISDYILNTNSTYNNIVDYLVNLIPFYFMLYPLYTTDKNETTKNRMLNAAKTIAKIQLENVAPQMLKKAILYGEAYFYDLSDGDNTIIDSIPKEICILSHIDDDSLWRYYVDLSLINSNTLAELPQEIQDAYNTWNSDGRKKSKKTDGIEVPSNYYQVSKRGFAIFCHMNKKIHDYPMLVHMFADLTMLTNDKSYFNEFVKDDAVKTIHMKVPTNADGEPLMGKEDVEPYHISAKEHVGKNISILTNPFEVEGISLDNNQRTAINVVEHDSKVIGIDSGISETIYNANTTNGLGFSTTKDAAKIYPLLYFFNNFVNYKIKQYKCQVQFLHVNIFDKDDVHEKFRTDLLSGGSRIAFMGTTGAELFAYLCMLEAEKECKYDDLLVPKMNASQQSGVENPNGRPEKNPKDKADSTNVVDANK